MHVTNTVNGVDLDRLTGTIGAIQGDRTLARFEFRAANKWIDGGHNRSTIQDFYGAGREDPSREEPFVLDADEPPVLLGHDQAPNAPEYVLHALAACLTGTMAYHAAARGIVIDTLECTVEGDLDLHGFLGLDEQVRCGYQGIRVTFRITGEFSDDELGTLAELTRFSPVRDTIINPVPVRIEVRRG